MQKRNGSLARLAFVAALFLLVSGGNVACTQPTASPPTTAPKPVAPTAAPAAVSTKAPEATKPAAVPTKAVEPTKPAAVTRKVDYPQKGRSISLTVGFAPGGANDIGIRLLGPVLEKELGVPVEIINKPGASTQVQLTELARAKPDGYTVGQMAAPNNMTVYLDPTRKAVFTRKDFELVANYAENPASLGVLTGSPYRTLKDLLDDARAKPGQIKVGTGGRMVGPHLGVLQLGKVADVKFACVHFDSGGQALTALLGGHVDVDAAQPTPFLPYVKSGEVRILGVMDKERSELVPDVKTMEEQGQKVYAVLYHGLGVPAGTPKEIQDILSNAVKRALADPEVQNRMLQTGLSRRYMDGPTFSKAWAEMEVEVEPLIDLAKSN